MKSRYKIILSNKNLYREIEIPADYDELSVGTAVDEDYRLRKDLFFDSIHMDFRKVNNVWTVFCSDNLYFDLGDSRKLVNIKLTHGSTFKVCYQNSDSVVFSVEFSIDFDYAKKIYDRKIMLQSVPVIKIGGTTDSHIFISDEYMGQDSVILKNQNGVISLSDNGCRYGVNVNGERISAERVINNYDFFSIVGFSFFYKDGFLYTSSDSKIQIQGLRETIIDRNSTVFEYPKFNRNTRIQYDVTEEPVEIQQPTQKPSLNKKSILMTLIPALVMLCMTIVLRGILGGGGMFVIYSAVSMTMGVIMSIITYVQDKKNFRLEVETRDKSYRQYVKEKEELILRSRQNELRVLNIIYESLDNSIAEVESFGRRLFEKTSNDKDFLQIYLGTGTVESANQVKFNKQEFIDTEDPISQFPEQISYKYKYIENAPIISDFNASCGIGIVGEARLLEQMLKNISLDIAIRHFFKDVKFFYILDGEFVNDFRWVRWLRNVENDQLDVRNIVCDEESKKVLLEYIYSILSARETALNQAEAGEGNIKAFDDQYVVFITNAESISTHPISKYIANAVKYGFTFVFLEEHEEEIPLGCTEIIRLNDASTGQVLKAINGDIINEFKYPMIADSKAEELALRLGAMCVDEVSLEGQLTKSITMFEMLDIFQVEDLDLSKRWSESQVYKTMAAPIGVKSSNELVCLNISDKGNGHGPHGLVAGTTGSGKSEILQTYILSIATLFHPYDVGFVIIDFKGGGMANQFENLPHLIGTITNIDGREIDRSLLSIKAELIKRQEMFSEAGVNHINDYIKLYKAGKVDVPMPHLIMIVDEFAELKAEYPDFMKELISAARIGRTLGVHLILATQKPAGVVDAQIWSNSKFKLCLKVQTKEDSNEVIKSPLAAEIVEPGRAYFQVGNNEIFELIQSAYSGANVPESGDSNERVFTIYERNLWGKKKAVFSNKKNTESSSEVSQLDAIVDHVSMYCKANDIDKLPGICLPSLDTVIKTDAFDYNSDSDAGYVVPVGFYDDPEMQKQDVVNFEVSKDNIYIVGSSQSGKTVLLQTLVYGLIKKYTPKQVNLFIVDCGSMVLKIFEDSKHVGGVVTSGDDEKCKNLFKLLNSIVVERKKILSSKGVGNFASYLEAGYDDMAQIVVVIDNMAGFKEYFPDQADQINSLTREAQGVGISFVITTAQSNALNYRAQANFSKKVALNCIDTNEYGSMFGHCRKVPREGAGSGFVMIDKRILEWQVAIFGKSKKEAERSSELRDFIEARNGEVNERSIKIPMVPEKLVLSEEMSQTPELFRNEGIVPMGVRFDTVEQDMFDIMSNATLTLLGDAESKNSFIKSFITVLAKNIVFHNAEALIIDDKQKSLEALSSFGLVRKYTSDVADGMSIINEFYDEVEKREDADVKNEDSKIILVFNNPDLMKAINADKTMSKELQTVIKKLSDLNAFVIFSQVENAVVGFNSSDVLKTLKEEKQGILFAPILDNKFYDMSARVKADPSYDKSMAYHFNSSTFYKIKLFT